MKSLALVKINKFTKLKKNTQSAEQRPCLDLSIFVTLSNVKVAHKFQKSAQTFEKVNFFINFSA